MKYLLLTGLLIACAQNLGAETIPLTSREIGLMLRSGYSSEAVVHELQKRHFGDQFDPAAEKQVTQAGANAGLLEVLRSGAYQASPGEVEVAEKKLELQVKVQTEAVARSTRTENLPAPDSKLPDSRSDAGIEKPNEVYRLIKDSLVYLNQGSVTRFDDEGLERKKYFLFFFSANSSPNGRKFTPKLVDYYSRVEPQHPEFDVIFFSADRSQFGMETYLRETNMPWAAVDYQQIAAKAAGMDSSIIQEIPCLVLIDRSGRVLSQTKSGENGKTPDEVLADVDQYLSGASAKQAH